MVVPRMRWWLLALALFFVLGPSGLAEPTPSPGVTASPTPTAGLAEVASQAEAVSDRLGQIEEALAQDSAYGSVKAGLLEFNRRVTGQLRDNDRALRSPTPTAIVIRTLDGEWAELKALKDQWKSQLVARANQLETQKRELEQLIQVWKGYQHEAEVNGLPADVVGRIESTLQLLDGTITHLEARLSNVLTLQDRLLEEQLRITRGVEELDQARSRLVHNITHQDSPALWSSGVSSQLTPQLWSSLRQLWREQVETLSHPDQDQSRKLLTWTTFLVALWAFFRWAREKAGPHLQAEPEASDGPLAFETPLASSLVCWSLLAFWFSGLSSPLLLAILTVVGYVAALLVVGRRLERPLQPLLAITSAFFVVDRLRLLLISIPLLVRLILCLELAAGVLVLAAFARRRRRALAGKGDAVVAVELSLRLILMTALLANLVGYVILSRLLANLVLLGTYLAIGLWALLVLSESLAFLFTRLGPLSRLCSVRNHRPWLRSHFHRLLLISGVGLWVGIVLELLSLRRWFWLQAVQLFQAPIGWGSVTTSLEQIFAFLATLWAAVAISAILRVVLEEDVFPRLQLGRGLPFAITTLLDYVIWLTGLVLAVSALGLPTTQFTVLSGAIGVGLGFGMQNIVSNFISGLILLFERPIKVGDSIQWGAHTGKLRTIGLRASILRLADGSDVIIPNSKLITEQVVNWTHSDQRRRLEFQLELAPEIDTETARQVLLQVVQAHQQVLPQPQPEVVMSHFTDKAQTLRVRAWSDCERWDWLHGELLTEAKNRLLNEGLLKAANEGGYP